MGNLTRIVVAGVLAISAPLLSTVPRAGAQQPGLRMQVLHGGQPVRVLAPGASFSVVTDALGSQRAAYCLGLVSMRDRFGLPVSLGVFRPAADGLMAVAARVPLSVFPAEPPGPFLLFAGRCTTVAPDGILVSAAVTIRPAVG
jgi:hypothetical protein